MKLKTVAIISTVLVVVVGFAMITPLFFRHEKLDGRVMLSFSVVESKNAAEWCRNLSAILDRYNLPATVFVVGEIAQQHPETVACFSDKVDVGSQTFSNADLTGISDYTVKLQEVKDGKTAVDAAAGVDSRVYQAPNGAIDQDIYSLLSRSNITADFSYKDHYNIYQNGQFIAYKAQVFDGQSCTPDYFLTRAKTAEPVIIQFNNTYTTANIESYVSVLVSGDFDFVNASQLTGLTLTGREA